MNTTPKSTREYVHMMFARDFAVDARLGGSGERGDQDVAALRSLSLETRRELYRSALISANQELTTGLRSAAPIIPGSDQEVVQRLWVFLTQGPDGLEG